MCSFDSRDRGTCKAAWDHSTLNWVSPERRETQAWDLGREIEGNLRGGPWFRLVDHYYDAGDGSLERGEQPFIISTPNTAKYMYARNDDFIQGADIPSTPANIYLQGTQRRRLRTKFSAWLWNALLDTLLEKPFWPTNCCITRLRVHEPQMNSCGFGRQM